MGYGAAPQPMPTGGQFAPQAAAPAPEVQPAAPIAGAPTPFGTTTPSGYAPGEFPGGPQAQMPPQQVQAHQQPAGGGWGPQPGMQQPGMQQPGMQQPGMQQPMGYSPYGAPPQGIQPMAAPGAGYAVPAAIGQHGPIGKMRNPIMVVVLTWVTCGLYGIVALFSMLGELKAFRQKNDINAILFLLPVIGWLEMIKLPAKVLDAKRMAGVPNAQEPNVILYFLLGIYMLPADLNEIWQVASAKQTYGALPPGGM
jgi:hypothetical protein